MEVPGDMKEEMCFAKHLDLDQKGETKADDNSYQEASEEKQKEDNDYHRNDEQVSICLKCNSKKKKKKSLFHYIGPSQMWAGLIGNISILPWEGWH